MTKTADRQAEDVELQRVVYGAHQELRERLDGIDACLADLAAGSSKAFAEAQAKFEALLVVVVRHLEREEALLAPILESIDSWGPARLVQLQHEHTAQRIQMAELASVDLESSNTVWVTRMKQFSTELRADMAAEERDFLPAAGLRARRRRSSDSRA